MLFILTDAVSTLSVNRAVSTPSVKRKREENLMHTFVSKSTPSQKKNFDEQIARYVYATNAPFASVEHPEFIKMVRSLRPEYVPPSRKHIAGDLLDSTYHTEKEKCASMLNGEIVTLGLDGWSNVHNEPVICVTLTTKEGNAYLGDTIDTTGTPHTGENLYDIACESIKKCEAEFQCVVRSLVTDNTSNVEKMRRLLDENEDLDIITYGCAAHILNLLANDISYPNVKEQVLQIIKHFRNNHFAGACYRKNNNAPKLILPSEVRWNSFADALQRYLDSWPLLIAICEANKDQMDKHIQSLVSNLALKRNAEDYLSQLKPISVALDRSQKENCSIADTVSIFKKLKKKLKDLKNKDLMKKFESRYQMAITPAHLLAYLLHPEQRDDDEVLTSTEKKEALLYAKKRFPANNLLTLVMKFCAKSAPFEEYLFEKDFVQDITAVEWWRVQAPNIEKAFNAAVLGEVELLLTAKSSTANVERVFSTFGVVQSKLRNRLGLEKAAKLVFLYKMLNPNC